MASTPPERPVPGSLSAADRELLEFMAEHRLVEVAHVQRLLGVPRDGAAARLRRLHAAGYTRREQPFEGRTTFHLISGKGLRAIGSPLRPPRFELGTHDHDVGAAWLWLAARAGTFGPLRDVIGERGMRSSDATGQDPSYATGAGRPYGVRVGGYGPGGRERLHYADLLLITPQGRRIAVELELSAKGRLRREQILAGYAADVRVDAVLYLVTGPRLARAIDTSARRMGIGGLVRVQMTSLTTGAREARDGARGRTAAHPSHRTPQEPIR